MSCRPPTRPSLPRQAPPQVDGASVGPSFDCAKAITPLPEIICGNADLRRLDLEFARPFYALRHLIPDRQDELREEADDLTRRVLASCRIPETGRASPALARQAAPCIAAAYRKQKEIWARRVEGSAPSSAREEISRSLEAHIRLQEQLRVVGPLPQDAPADGVYGGMTRQGIATLQRAEQLPSDGFLSNATAAQLSQTTTGAVRTEPPTANRSGPDPVVIQRIAALEQRHSDYLAELGAFERERAARAAAAERERAAKAAALAKLRGWRETLQPLLRNPIPDDVRKPLVSLATEIEAAERSGAPSDLPRIEA